MKSKNDEDMYLNLTYPIKIQKNVFQKRAYIMT